jgi:hypothetical protein
MGMGARLVGCITVGMLMMVAAANAATSGQVIAALNTQRAAAGLPAGIAENTKWSASCAKHNVYQLAHGGKLTHGESDKASPTYTSDGDAVSQGAVLTTGTWDRGNPFENAPIHLHQLLAPRLNVVGANESVGFSCTTTFGPAPLTPGYGRAPVAKPVLYTYPGPTASGLSGTEVADEGPFTPGEVLGIPRGTATGRYIMLFVDGPWSTSLPRIDVTAATVKPAGGQPIEIKVADRDVKTPDGRNLGDYLPQGAQLIPVQPLADNTTYEVSVSLSANGVPLSKSWSFGTGSAAGADQSTVAKSAPLPRLTIDKPRYRNRQLRFTIHAASVLVGRRATIVFKVPGHKKSIKQVLKLAGKTTVRIAAPRATVRVTVPSFTADGTRYGTIRASRAGRAS